MDIKSNLTTSVFLITLLTVSSSISANDSTGYVSTNGIQYIKNSNIAMTSENLFLSKNNITVDYRFDNESSEDVKETVLFPLPLVESFPDSDFADTAKLVDSFVVTANGKPVKTTVHTRAFVYPSDANGVQDFDAIPIDVTETFKKCGVMDNELRYPWTQKGDLNKITTKLRTCQDPAFQKIKPLLSPDSDYAMWYGQLVYSFDQTFKAHEPTFIHHSYAPLVGGSVMINKDSLPLYCASKDRDFLSAVNKRLPYQTMGYILKTGANWAKPIQNFKMTIERDKDEIVSYCWDGVASKVTKGNKVQFVMNKTNFMPSQDINILFINTKQN